MTDRTYRVTELVGTSKEGVDAAITNAISRAGETLRHLDWFEVTQIRGHVVDNADRPLPGRPEGRLPPRRLLTDRAVPHCEPPGGRPVRGTGGCGR